MYDSKKTGEDSGFKDLLDERWPDAARSAGNP
jgi:hypothetical protein